MDVDALKKYLLEKPKEELADIIIAIDGAIANLSHTEVRQVMTYEVWNRQSYDAKLYNSTYKSIENAFALCSCIVKESIASVPVQRMSMGEFKKRVSWIHRLLWKSCFHIQSR